MNRTKTHIAVEDVDSIAIGATVLGTGGGGDPYIGSLIAKRNLRRFGPVEVIALDELDDDKLVVPIGSIGAPSVSIEKIPAEEELTNALSAFERTTDKEIGAIMPIEIGGGNSMLPIAAAAARGLPLLDADAMGRAFPEAQMVTYHLAGLGPGDTVLVDAQANEIVARPRDGRWSERLARALTVEMGGSATMIDYVYPASIARECVIPGTLSAARRIGEILTDSQIKDEARIPTMLAELSGHRLFDGKIAAIERAIVDGFTRGCAELQGIGSDKGLEFTLFFQNEMLWAKKDGTTVAVTPDLITVLDQATGLPITTESLRYGARVTVVAFPCHAQWRTEAGLETAGPQYFGYDVQYEPVEALVGPEVLNQVEGDQR